MIRTFAILATVALSGCGSTGTITEKEFQTVNVPVRRPCPEPETKAKVDAARPVPLRAQPRPATEDEARAAERAQLGRYEAPNGWADQAQAVMDSCAAEVPFSAAGE